MTTAFDFTATGIDGTEIPLDQYRGQVLLIVNTASRCGFTGQYAGLEALHEKHSPKGFQVLGFPCNQFGAQEPGKAAEIAAFCSSTYGVRFPLFDKIEVNGPSRHPLYAWLTDQKKGFLGSREIKWNFTKFLTDREGRVVERFAPQVEPATLEPAVVALL